jgi:hypothetical protein
MRRFIIWAGFTGFVLAGAAQLDAQEPWRPEWKARRAQAELPVPGPQPETTYVVPGPESYEGGSPESVSQRMSALQAELNMLRQQMRGQMAAPPGAMPMPGEIIYEGEMPYGAGEGPYDGHVAGAQCCMVTPGGCCGDTCGPLSFGADGIFLHPSVVGNQAFVISTPTTSIGSADQGVAFDWDTEASYRVWVALKDCDRNGIRGSFWRFENSISEFATLEPNQTAFAQVTVPGNFLEIAAFPGMSIDASHRLDLAVVDLEIVKDILWPKAMLTLSAGLRYARNEQNYEVDVIDLDGDTISSLQHLHRFEGVGPSIGFELRKCIGCCGFSVYLRSKGSAVFGQMDTSVEEVEFGVLTNTYNGEGFDEPLLIGEVGFGIQYSWHKLWLRAGYEAQYWMNAGSASSTGGDLGLVGFAASAGLGF